MIRLSVMYPKGDDATFDLDYYTTKHFEIVDRTMKPTRWEVDSGIDGPYIAVGNLYFDDMEALQSAMTEGEEAQQDVANFTNVTADIQISEIVAG